MQEYGRKNNFPPRVDRAGGPTRKKEGVTAEESTGSRSRTPRDHGLYRKTKMKFSVIRSASPYNIILGRSGLRELRAIPSTLHAMMKFPTPGGIATLVTRAATILECRKREEEQLVPEEENGLTNEPTFRDNKNELAPTEEVLVHPAYPDQPVTIGTGFS
ncbi:hypothetical protein CTI12_AA371000 [Artemisia annua]|uniref:Reverse transcriptase domain-containing protein n=1 Tax=Artemisia annua TaxID=35608 RepID=A0A2U1MH57_ARTAN|nr:hypothetical protein CTI12_AA371000 [Artemisia annua]